MQMKTDTGKMKEGDCTNDQRNYICEIPASTFTTSIFYIIRFYIKVKVKYYADDSLSMRSNNSFKPKPCCARDKVG